MVGVLEADQFPFEGQVVWLTPEQGGRDSGPPPPRDTWPHFAVTAFVPPHNADDGLASFVLRDFVERAWRSRARGRGLIVDNDGDQLVVAGSVVAITEGRRVVAYFTVESVRSA